ncbi:MAG: DUF1566 domain-containing protein [Nitrospirota bacterium]|nr:DUF1566 domain-containing protein [Nitrospirota bacterium]
MRRISKTIGILVFGSVVSFGLLVSGVQAQSGSLEPPGSAVNGSGNPVATTQTQPSWDQDLPSAQRFVTVLTRSLFASAILDKNTGLVWEIAPGDTNGDALITTADQVSWDDARRHCLAQSDGGVRGWRLPSVHELLSLVDPENPSGNPVLPPGHPFSGVQSSNYWSATTNVENPTLAWDAHFSLGFVDILNKTSTNFVWCVRGGGPLSDY